MRALSSTKRLINRAIHATSPCTRSMMAAALNTTKILSITTWNKHLRMTCLRWHGNSNVAVDAPRIHLAFHQPNGTKKNVEAIVGESLLQTAHRNDIDLEGACEGGTFKVVPCAVCDSLSRSVCMCV